MGYESEAKMVDKVAPELADSFGNEQSKSYREFSYGGGYTDFVVARISPSYYNRRVYDLSLPEPITQRDRLKAFTKIHSRDGITWNYFLESLGGDKLKGALEWLIDTGFVQEVGNKLQSARNLRRHVTTGYAFEFKLHDWKRALQQAFQAKSYANFQYVVMDESSISPALDNKDMFEKYNVGLISAKEDGDFYIEIKTERESPSTPVSAWGLNESTISGKDY